jgi:hypothetical protein
MVWHWGRLELVVVIIVDLAHGLLNMQRLWLAREKEKVSFSRV